MKSKTKSRGKNVFSKTVLKNLEQSLSSEYGNEKADLIFEKASSILNNELNNLIVQSFKTQNQNWCGEV